MLGAPTRYEVCARGGGVLAVPVGRSRALLQLWDGGKPARALAHPCGYRTHGRACVRRRVSRWHPAFHAWCSPLNPPFDWDRRRHNDAEGAARLIAERAPDLAAVIVEPVQGAAGVIPGDPAFLRALREATAAHGVLLVFDEVMTARLALGGDAGGARDRPRPHDAREVRRPGRARVGAFGGRPTHEPLHLAPGRSSTAGRFRQHVLTITGRRRIDGASSRQKRLSASTDLATSSATA